MPHLDTAPTKAVDEVVKVDYKIHGCPIDRKEFTYVVRCLLIGKTAGDTGISGLCRMQGQRQSLRVGLRAGLSGARHKGRLRGEMPIIGFQVFRLPWIC